jgi:hypothetical protein
MIYYHVCIYGTYYYNVYFIFYGIIIIYYIMPSMRACLCHLPDEASSVLGQIIDCFVAISIGSICRTILYNII